MKKRLEKMLCFVISVMLLLGSVPPVGAMAEELPTAKSNPQEQAEPSGFNEIAPISDDQMTGASSEDTQTGETGTAAASENNLASPAEPTKSTMETEGVTVMSALAVSLKPDKASPQNRNATVLFTATVTGGTAPYSYQFSVNSEPLEESQSNTASIPLTEAGEYSITVEVTDANGEIANNIATPYKYVIRNNPLPALTVTPDESVNHYVNDPITLSATVDGGKSPFSYRFYYKLGTQKVEIKNPTNADEMTFKPTVAGTYDFQVDVIDANGLKKTASKTGYTVLPLVTATSFTTDKPSGQNVGTAIKLTANGAGGKEPYTYEFYYQLDNSDVQVPIEEDKDPAVNMVEFEPTVVGVYTLGVRIKDSNETPKETVKEIFNYRIVNGPVIDNFTAVNSSDEEKPTYVGDSVLLSVDLAVGSESDITYNYTIKNGTKTIKTITQKGDSYLFIPVSPGTYTFVVKATDKDGLSDTKSASLVVLDTIKATLKANKPSGQSIHTDINLTAAAAGGKAPYTYEFEYEYAGGTPQILQYESQSKTAVFTIDDPAKVGLYTLRVKVTDANGVVAEAVEITDFRITNPPVIDNFTAAPEKGAAVYPGEEITLTAEVSEGSGEKSPLDYQFYVNGKLLTAADAEFPTPGICKYTPKTGGVYNFEVAVTDGVTTARQKISSYKVIGGVQVTSLTSSKRTGIVGETITLTAAGSGGQPAYTYQFFVKIDGAAAVPIEPVDATKKTISYTPQKAGTYTFYVVITDKNNRPSANGEEKAISVTVTAPPIIDTLVISSDGSAGPLTSSYFGKAITLTATPKVTDPVLDLTYTFSYKFGSKTTIIEKDTDGTVNFTPPAAGIYTFYVTATDKDSGLTSPIFTVSNFTVLKAFTVKSLKTNKPSGQNINTPIKLTATAEGGKEPYTYTFSQKLKTAGGDPEVIENTGNSASYTPTTAGTYTFAVEITDANNKTVSTSIDFEVNNPPVVTLTTNKEGQPIYQEDNVELTATVDKDTGVGEMKYRFYWKQGTESGDLTTETVDGRTATAVFTPETPGSYTLMVDVTDGNNEIKTAQLKSVKVLAPVSVSSLVIDKEAPQNIGTTIKLTADGTGGKSPYKYQFFYMLDSADDSLDISEWKSIGTQTASKSVSFPLKYAGTYQFKVVMTDGNGIKNDEADPNASYENYVVVDTPVITRFTATPSLKHYVEEPIVLTAAAKGGSGDYSYEFSYENSEGETTVLTDDDDTTPGVLVFDTITDPGTYKFKVVVTDTENDDATTNSAEKIISYTVANKPTVKTFTCDKEGPVKKSSTIKLTAAGQDGFAPYQFLFSVKIGTGTKKIIRSFSSAPSFSYKLPATGDYTFYVTIKDSKGTTVLSDKEINLVVE